MSSNGWREVTLGDVARYSNARITTDELTLENYVSTENMLSNKAGKTLASSIPSGTAIKYRVGQTLISNIRPYFKKIWHASMDGGCSADVLVFETTDEIDDKYFFYYLNQDHFFDYVMGGSKGTKMPRGDKQQILMYSFKYPEKEEQKAIAATLSCLDDKIELNNRINKTLEEMAQAIFKSWFIDFEPFQDGEFEDSELGLIPKGWRIYKLSEVIEINPTRKIARGSVVPYLDMSNMPTQGHSPSLWIEREVGSGMKFMNGDTLIARITPCLENGKTAYIDFLADNELGWGSTEYIVLRPRKPIPTQFAYLVARNERFRSFAVGKMTGSSGRQRVPADSIAPYPLILPPLESDIWTLFGRLVESQFEIMKNMAEQSRTLTKIRDTLLPKLMSGEIRVPVEEVE
jgi:type I restriction enzyme S subunit